MKGLLSCIALLGVALGEYEIGSLNAAVRRNLLSANKCSGRKCEGAVILGGTDLGKVTAPKTGAYDFVVYQVKDGAAAPKSFGDDNRVIGEVGSLHVTRDGNSIAMDTKAILDINPKDNSFEKGQFKGADIFYLLDNEEHLFFHKEDSYVSGTRIIRELQLLGYNGGNTQLSIFGKGAQVNINKEHAGFAGFPSKGIDVSAGPGSPRDLHDNIIDGDDIDELSMEQLKRKIKDLENNNRKLRIQNNNLRGYTLQLYGIIQNILATFPVKLPDFPVFPDNGNEGDINLFFIAIHKIQEQAQSQREIKEKDKEAQITSLLSNFGLASIIRPQIDSFGNKVKNLVRHAQAKVEKEKAIKLLEDEVKQIQDDLKKTNDDLEKKGIDCDELKRKLKESRHTVAILRQEKLDESKQLLENQQKVLDQAKILNEQAAQLAQQAKEEEERGD